jgi:2-C-methyl-D-erythritol 4-phosphate cytidylyltransferase / 2-C-methyl-D-erythritol 2,4-cyclodiphosphate synthase
MQEKQPISQKFYAVIVAAGQGLRFGSARPKQFEILKDRIVLSYATQTFHSCPECQGLVVVLPDGYQNFLNPAEINLSQNSVCIGGASRQESVFLGLQHLQKTFPNIGNAPVLIHDGARPFVTHTLIFDLLRALPDFDAVTVALSSVDSVRWLDQDKKYLAENIDRDHIKTIQTPQAFRFEDLLHLHKLYQSSSAHHNTDDTILFYQAEKKVGFIEGDPRNIKITTPQDLKMAELFLSSPPSSLLSRRLVKVGSGFDVHAFGEEAEFIRLGGIDIPFTKKLAGHSDADVVLHALTDAIYGCLASGDIGSHFPPSDMSYKNMDSRIFLEKAHQDLQQENGLIVHVDITIIGEEPKITPYRLAMRKKMAEILKTDLKNISVKATTTEKLGFTGRKEGLACQATVTVEFCE